MREYALMPFSHRRRPGWSDGKPAGRHGRAAGGPAPPGWHPGPGVCARPERRRRFLPHGAHPVPAARGRPADALAASWPRLPAVAAAGLSSIDTNVPVWLWPRLGVALLRAGDGIDTRTVSREMVTPYTTDEGAMVLLPNWELITPGILSSKNSRCSGIPWQ